VDESLHLNAPTSEGDMDTSDGKDTAPMESSPDVAVRSSAERKSVALLHPQLTDDRPATEADSEAENYIAWLNGSGLVTARQTSAGIAMILPVA
jgi:hypothetical protein